MSATRLHALRLVAAAATILAGCGTTEIGSHWRQNGLILSGSGPGWPPSATTFEDRRISGTVYNDSEYIYIGLRTNNRDLQRLMLREGITWWFDRDGGGKKSFGVHYPLPASGKRPPGGDEERDGVPPPADREEQMKLPTELELYTGENEHERMSILATGGIEAGFHRQRDTLVYELRVPLAAGAKHPFGIGVSRGTLIGLGAVTTTTRGASDMPIDRQENEGEPEGGFGGRRSGGGRARGGSRTDAGLRTDQLNLWLKVRLAEGE
jgi:hypothetical protein